MKKLYLLVLILIVPMISACTPQKTQLNQGVDTENILEVDDEGNTSFNVPNLSNRLSTYVAGNLTEEEKQGILYMIEEEKLAHDVYTYLYDKWSQNVFDNISNSEQTHTEAVQNLATRYGLEIPESVNTLGQYQNSDLQKLYNDLTSQGSTSLLDALKVGAAIEEIDILDLEEYIAQTDKEDLILVYENLMQGSRNHLRSFVRNMERNNFNYSAQYMNSGEYEGIITSDMERGNGNQGQGAGRGRR